jgi:hypothetical protein
MGTGPICHRGTNQAIRPAHPDSSSSDRRVPHGRRLPLADPSQVEPSLLRSASSHVSCPYLPPHSAFPTPSSTITFRALARPGQARGAPASGSKSTPDRKRRGCACAAPSGKNRSRFPNPAPTGPVGHSPLTTLHSLLRDPLPIREMFREIQWGFLPFSSGVRVFHTDTRGNHYAWMRDKPLHYGMAIGPERIRGLGCLRVTRRQDVGQRRTRDFVGFVFARHTVIPFESRLTYHCESMFFLSPARKFLSCQPATEAPMRSRRYAGRCKGMMQTMRR